MVVPGHVYATMSALSMGSGVREFAIFRIALRFVFAGKIKLIESMVCVSILPALKCNENISYEISSHMFCKSWCVSPNVARKKFWGLIHVLIGRLLKLSRESKFSKQVKDCGLYLNWDAL